MIYEPEKITQLAAELIEYMERVVEDSLGTIDDVMVIAAVNFGDNGEEGKSGVFLRCSSNRTYIQYGLLNAAKRIVEGGQYEV